MKLETGCIIWRTMNSTECLKNSRGTVCPDGKGTFVESRGALPQSQSTESHQYFFNRPVVKKIFY